MTVTKHPAFCEVSLSPPPDMDESKKDAYLHTPFDSMHQKIKGITHSNIRYFTKKHWRLADDILVILGLIKQCFPLLDKFFPPDLRKMFDIAYREKKQKLYELDPSRYQNPQLQQGASLNSELYQIFRRYQIENNLAKKIIQPKEGYKDYSKQYLANG